jgi:hypothetical protein
LRVLLIALFSVRNLNRKIEESVTMPTFIKVNSAPGSREGAAFPKDSFHLDSSLSLLHTSQ